MLLNEHDLKVVELDAELLPAGGDGGGAAGVAGAKHQDVALGVFCGLKFGSGGLALEQLGHAGGLEGGIHSADERHARDGGAVDGIDVDGLGLDHGGGHGGHDDLGQLGRALGVLHDLHVDKLLAVKRHVDRDVAAHATGGTLENGALSGLGDGVVQVQVGEGCGSCGKSGAADEIPTR